LCGGLSYWADAYECGLVGENSGCGVEWTKVVWISVAVDVMLGIVLWINVVGLLDDTGM
jgi:hypothetical protein